MNRKQGALLLEALDALVTHRITEAARGTTASAHLRLAKEQKSQAFVDSLEKK